MSAEEKAIEEAGKTARHYLDGILLRPLSEVGLLLRDQVSFWRFKNQVNMTLKARQFLESKGINPTVIANSVLPETIVPLLEAGSNTSDETLSEMFSGLLASAIDPTEQSLSHPSFHLILSQLSPIEAKLAALLYYQFIAFESQPAFKERVDPFSSVVKWLFARDCQRRLVIGSKVEEMASSNLKRLGLVREWQYKDGDKGHPCLELTIFGRSFMQACLQYASKEEG